MKKLAVHLGEGLHAMGAGLDKRQAEQAVESLVAQLASRQRLDLLPEIIKAYEAKAKRARGVETVSVTSAAAPSDRQQEEMEASLRKAAGAEIEIEWKTDPALIGGAVIRHDDALLDTSVRRRLELLKQQLN